MIKHQIGVGLIGLGEISKVHIDVLKTYPNISILFGVDQNSKVGEKFTTECCEPFYTSTEKAFDDHQPQLVVISTPTHTHEEVLNQVLSISNASQILVEKPLAENSYIMDRLFTLKPELQFARRVFVAHHFSFSPEVLWATQLMAKYPEWGLPINISSVFYDPYIANIDSAVSSLTSSWIDSGPNQLSILSRWIDLSQITHIKFFDKTKSSSSCSFTFEHSGMVGTAFLCASWHAIASSKKTTIKMSSGVEFWLDHTAVAGYVFDGSSVLTTLKNQGEITRKMSHYIPLYNSLFSGQPDMLLTADMARKIINILSRD